MIEFIHKYPILIKVLLTITTVAFVFTGGYFMSQEQAQLAAKVDDEPITMQEYQTAYYNLEDFYKRIYQGNMPEGMLDNLKLDQMALNNLIDRKVMLISAEDLGLGVTDDEVADAVRENASFQGEDGKFSKKVYLDALKYNNLTPQAYEKSLKDDLVAEKFRNMVKDSVAVTDADVRAFYMDQMKATGSPVDENAFAENMENYRRSLESMDQDKTFKSVIEGLKANCKIEKYILQEGAPFTS
ncbi:MAG TPA: SurA N-terminal domain-containing protein [Nitrospirota bacterium]